MKKLFATGMACLMAVSMCACSGSGEKNSYNIGIVQLVQHPALDAATEGFQDALIEKLGEDKVNRQWIYFRWSGSDFSQCDSSVTGSCSSNK